MSDRQAIAYIRLDWAFSALQSALGVHDDKVFTTEIMGRTYFLHGGELHNAPMFASGGYDVDAIDSAWEILHESSMGAEDAEELIEAIETWMTNPTYLLGN